MCRALFWMLGTHQCTNAREHDRHRYQKNTEQTPLILSRRLKEENPGRTLEKMRRGWWRKASRQGKNLCMEQRRHQWAQGRHSPALLGCMGGQGTPGLDLGGKTRWPGICNVTTGLRAPLRQKSDFEEPKAQEWCDLIPISNIISWMALICKHCVSCTRGLKKQKNLKKKTHKKNRQV